MLLVLHFEVGIVFGDAFGNRQLGDPKQDGTFNWSSGGFRNGYGKLSLYKDLYETIDIGRRDSDDFDNPYLIGDKKVTEKEYLIFRDEQNEKESAVWYDFTEKNIQKEVTNHNSADDKTDWKKAYKNYLVAYTPEMGFITTGLVDFNADEQPELIILDDSHGTLGGRYTIVSFQNGIAVEVCQYGMSSSITEVDSQLFFYRDFDSIRSGGGTHGYGFVSRLDYANGAFSITNLLQASIDYNYDNALEELSWQLEGEENVLRSSDFKNYLSIHKMEGIKWQNISNDEYSSLKTTYIGAEPTGKQITDFFKYKHDFFDSSDNTHLIAQNELDDFFDEWSK
jgi:hypothetical protein